MLNKTETMLRQTWHKVEKKLRFTTTNPGIRFATSRPLLKYENAFVLHASLNGHIGMSS